MSNVLGVRNRPGPAGSGAIAAGNGTFELQDYQPSPTVGKLTFWILAPAAYRLDVYRWDATFGPSGIPGGAHPIQSFVGAGSTSETPFVIDQDIGGSTILRAVVTDTSGAPQASIVTRVGERRSVH